MKKILISFFVLVVFFGSSVDILAKTIYKAQIDIDFFKNWKRPPISYNVLFNPYNLGMDFRVIRQEYSESERCKTNYAKSGFCPAGFFLRYRIKNLTPYRLDNLIEEKNNRDFRVYVTSYKRHEPMVPGGGYISLGNMQKSYSRFWSEKELSFYKIFTTTWFFERRPYSFFLDRRNLGINTQGVIIVEVVID